MTDAVNAAEEEFGLPRLLEVMRAAHHCSAGEIEAKMTAAVQAHVGAVEAFDDMTMVVLKRTA
ncbi:MAG: SpoIIE family protein phosphatase [Chloroflexi bacterium]|nr:SpoIIE family protein phosphatase [Chloroflexota bacterium]